VSVYLTISELDLHTLFPFALDEFQQQALAALNAGRSVVVCAPTGSGKTLIGEYAIYRALAREGRVFYTTPLKALSNQKFRDFRAQFGHELVGLLTGDVSINREAPILVMTTEIFRNMLYGTPIGEVGTSLVGVEAVVLDECHYMNDWQRGTVWEESIVYCPPDIQLLALSATVANSQQLTDWIDRVHGPTELIYSDFRPVPLQFYFANPKGIFPLLNDTQTKISPRLEDRRSKRSRRDGERKPRPESPDLDYVVGQLSQRDMLPAIYFIFSRRGCDRAVEDSRDLTLLNDQEAAQLKEIVDEFLTRSPEAGRAGQIEPLYRGIAAHHAGILPAWKVLVEELFAAGLVKVVFATETLAAGINMPARTTVISSLSKRTDRGHRLLTPSEFLQMAGRAGRRGMDTVGHVVTVQTRFEGAREAAYLATSKPDPLVSQFTPSYGMVLNLLQTHTLEEAKELVERSFGQYLATLHLKPEQDAIAALERELAQVEALLTSVEPALLEKYEKLQERLKVEQKIL
jgi:superfamily II RNA helicase